MSASGFPAGAIANFSPTVVIPGNDSETVGLSIQTKALAMQATDSAVRFGAFLLVGLSLSLTRRRRKLLSTLAVGFAMFGLVFSVGCGDREFTGLSHTAQSFPITVTATSTNLAGTVVTHTASVILIVQ
jgi:hypothetical protein